MKLGIVGNGMIVKRLLQDIQENPEAKTLIGAAAICVRPASREKGMALAQAFGLELFCDYEAFLQSDVFDTVYIGIVNREHFSYAKAALEAGKHVVCEKPFTVHAEETKLLAKLAGEKQLFLWEAFKIPYSPVYQELRRRLPELGRIRLVQCNYSRVSSRYEAFCRGEVHPAFDPEFAGGCLYDINLYNLHFVTGLFGRPKKVHYYANLAENGIDTSGTVILEYEGFPAVCSGAKDSSSPCFGMIQGTRGCLRVEGPVSAAAGAELITAAGTEVIARDENPGTLTAEMLAFARQLDQRDTRACNTMLEHSIMMMEVLEAARTDGGVSFEG